MLIVFFRKILLGLWSIKVFKANSIISSPVHDEKLRKTTLTAKDVTDVPAEFIADPFLLYHNSVFYLFFEVLEKSSSKGVIGLATSINGESWKYEKIVLKEDFHLSYPYVFIHNNEFYMIPESSQANQVLLYKSKSFPYEWEIECKLLDGKYVDSSIFQYHNKWWLFSCHDGKLHLFFSENLKGTWIEHPMSPIYSNNNNITRPGGRVIVDNNKIYRYTQDGEPNYGSSIRVFNVKELSEVDYLEEEINLILKGTNKKLDWRKDGMHTIDQLMINKNEWLIAVDGHKLVKRFYLFWKIDRLFSKVRVKF